MNENKDMFNNRVYGCAVVKAVNANYNADFSGQPRTLPSGVIYATDKAFKYSIKNYIKDAYPKEKVFYFKSFDEEGKPLDLTTRYKFLFPSGDENSKAGDNNKEDKKGKKDKKEYAKNLISCIDIRLFGATYAGDTNLSIHGPVQVSHGVNIWPENNIYWEQISSPFANNNEGEKKEMSTLGRQSRLEEGHYLHHFSINPKNLDEIKKIARGENEQNDFGLTEGDISILKEAMKKGVTWYDSASKAGCENELLVWIELKEKSKIVLPNLTGLIKLKSEKINGKCVYDFNNLRERLESEIVAPEIESIEIYYDKDSIEVENIPEGAKKGKI